jgi:hypothetical protein
MTAGSAPRKLRFIHHVIDADPPGGKDCCTDVLMAGDLNGDGRTELVLGGEFGPADLVWYEQPQPGHWLRHPAGEGDFTTDGVVCDLNGDGRPEVVTAGPLSWFELPADPREPWRRHRIAEAGAHDIVVADIDGDGQAEVVTVNKSENLLLFYHRGSDPTALWEPHLIDSAPGEGLCVADVDGDGRLDVLMGSCWYRAPKEPARGKWERYPICSSFPADTRIRWADIDGDGTAEIVMVASEGPSRVSWFRRPPDVLREEWTEHVIEDSGLVGLHSLQVADFDGDGRLDLLTGEMHTSPTRRVLVFQQIDAGAGKWRRHVLSEQGTHNACLADLNADGHPDVVGKNYAGEKGSVRRLEWWETVVE